MNGANGWGDRWVVVVGTIKHKNKKQKNKRCAFKKKKKKSVPKMPP